MSTRDEAIQIRVDEQRIAGTLVAPGTLIPGVLFVHGWGGSQENYLARARQIAALGCVCLTFNLRGHAETEPQHETVTREENLRDLVAAYDVLARQPLIDKEAIAVVGSSYGAYLAAILTALRPVRWLALRVPALYKDEDWALPKQQLKKYGLAAYRRLAISPDENRVLGACAAFQGDVPIVESEHDDIIPHPVIANYMAASEKAHSLTYRVIDQRLAGEHVIRGNQVAQVLLARHCFVLRLGLGGAAQVEGQADAAERRDLACTRQIILLTAAPTVHEQHAGDERVRRHQRSGDALIVHPDLNGFVTRAHKARPRNISSWGQPRRRRRKSKRLRAVGDRCRRRS